jgi:hypothetical protein
MILAPYSERSLGGKRRHVMGGATTSRLLAVVLRKAKMKRAKCISHANRTNIPPLHRSSYQTTHIPSRLPASAPLTVSTFINLARHK